MARKGWENLSEAYRNRLIMNRVTQADYESGQPLYKARGHRSATRESFNRRVQRYASSYQAPGVDAADLRSHIRSMGEKQGSEFMSRQRMMTRMYERGETDAARALWDTRDTSLPDYMHYYHGVFGH